MTCQALPLPLCKKLTEAKKRRKTRRPAAISYAIGFRKDICSKHEWFLSGNFSFHMTKAVGHKNAGAVPVMLQKDIFGHFMG